MRKFPVEAFRGLYYAHRGLYDNEHGIPENSLLWEFIVKGVDIEKLY